MPILKIKTILNKIVVYKKDLEHSIKNVKGNMWGLLRRMGNTQIRKAQ